MNRSHFLLFGFLLSTRTENIDGAEKKGIPDTQLCTAICFRTYSPIVRHQK